MEKLELNVQQRRCVKSKCNFFPPSDGDDDDNEDDDDDDDSQRTDQDSVLLGHVMLCQ
jgi:hypothetical protein